MREEGAVVACEIPSLPPAPFNVFLVERVDGSWTARLGGDPTDLGGVRSCMFGVDEETVGRIGRLLESWSGADISNWEGTDE